MHFFTEINKLENQTVTGESFGPLNSATSGPPVYNQKFDIGSTFKIDTGGDPTAKVYACQTSMMVVLQSNADPNLVNIVLRPAESSKIRYSTVKYYVYKGVSKSSFIDGSGKITPQATDNTTTIAKFWTKWIADNPTLDPATDAPGPEIFGYGSTATAALIDDIFNNGLTPIVSRRVDEGEWIGNFADGATVTFEAMVGNETLLPPTIAYFMAGKRIIDVSFLMPATTPAALFSLSTAREAILAYVDPAALYGMHYDVGVGIDGNADTKKGADLYTVVLEKFATRNRVYIDIRSEKGYSYNYNENYNDGSGNRLQVKAGTTASVDTPYYTHDWPIYYTDTAIDTLPKALLEINLRINDNSDPILHVENIELLGAGARSNFLDSTALGVSGTDWTGSVKLEIPNYDNSGTAENIAHHLFLQYFRNANTTTSPATVYPNTNSLNEQFGELLVAGVDAATVFGHTKNDKRMFIRERLGAYSFVAETGAYFDTDTVVYYNQSRFPNVVSTNLYPRIDFSDVPTTLNASKVLPRELYYNKWEILEIGATIPVNILEIVGYNIDSRSTPVENLHLLGLTKTEYYALAGLNSLDFHAGSNRYVIFNDQSTVDQNGIRYFKYALGVRGKDATGAVIERYPTAGNEIFVYGSNQTLLCSEDFAATSNLPNQLRDPGVIKKYANTGSWSYDENDPYVQATDANGFVNVEGVHMDLRQKRKVELKAEVHFPADAAGNLDTSGAPYPLIVIIHGNGHLYTEYTEISKHLASNGFIVASLSCLLMVRRKYQLYDAGSGYYYLNIAGTTAAYFYHHTSQTVGFVSGSTYYPLSTFTYDVNFKIRTSGVTPTYLIFTPRFESQHMDSLGRANLLYPHLEVLKRRFGDNIKNSIGLIGHSRGGESVVRAATDLTNDPSLGVSAGGSWSIPLNNVDAVFSLAPTDMWDQEALTDPIPYYVLYGSRDGDVSGVGKGEERLIPDRDLSTTPRRGTGAFSLWDRAENSTEKGMAFMYRATHNGFVTRNKEWRGTAEPPENQKRALKVYTNAFFLKWLNNESEWDRVVRGDYIPSSIGKMEIYHQYRDMSSSLVVDNFNDTTSSTPAWKKTSENGDVTYVSTPPPTNDPLELDLLSVSPAPHSPHDTRALQVSWEGKTEELTFTMPALTPIVDVSGLEYLSFRITYDVEYGSYQTQINGLQVRLTDNPGMSHPIIINRRIPIPDDRDSIDGEIKSAMMTIRIPLNDYATNGVDLSQIELVTFVFPSGGDGRIHIDDVEFSN